MGYFYTMIKDQQLTTNFRLSEWFVSLDQPELAAKMTASPHEIYKIRIMAATILQPARDTFGKIVVTSGKRSVELNSLVGGSDTSQHLNCEATDFVPLEADIEEVSCL